MINKLKLILAESKDSDILARLRVDHDGNEEVFHTLLKEKEWNNFELVSLLADPHGDGFISGVYGPGEWRNCNICQSTLLKKM